MLKLIVHAMKTLTIKEFIMQGIFTSKRMLYSVNIKVHDNCFPTQFKWKREQNMRLCLAKELKEIDITSLDYNVMSELLRMYEEHRFDLLGSGWVKCSFDENAPGVEEYRYPELVIHQFDKEGEWLRKIVSTQDLERSKKIYQMISGHYIPIDWQKDFKSGYRWCAKESYRPIKIAKEYGVDIKVPWELARLQHLPRLALCYRMMPEKQEIIKQEYMNIILDFICQNPVRKGVNWMCTMDVGIRTANMVVSLWLFDAFGASFPQQFLQIFRISIQQHCEHIWHNQEWSAEMRSNHYLANICGLLFGAALLSDNSRRKKWLIYARREYSRELAEQFYDEGSNFEGSVGYHRLSGEMVLYTGALISYLARKDKCSPLSEDELQKLYRIGKFAEATLTPDGSFVQIGDNDSGRFINLTPLGEMILPSEAIDRYESLDGYIPQRGDRKYLDEQINSPKQLIALCDGISYGGESECALEKSIIEILLGTKLKNPKQFRPSRTEYHFINEKDDWYEHRWTIPAAGNKSLKDNMCYLEYPQFGIYIYHSDRMYLCINGTDNGQKGNAGHAHNDKLSFELWIDGEPIFRDPGTYVYTAMLDRRDDYRGNIAHNIIETGEQQNVFKNTFSMYNRTECHKVCQEGSSISVSVLYNNIYQSRTFSIRDNEIEIVDKSSAPIQLTQKNIQWTNGYGKVLRKKVMV